MERTAWKTGAGALGEKARKRPWTTLWRQADSGESHQTVLLLFSVNQQIAFLKGGQKILKATGLSVPFRDVPTLAQGRENNRASGNFAPQLDE